MIKKLGALFIALLVATTSFAQTQYGFVKTRGRLDSQGNLIPGKGLKGASVYIKEQTPVVVINENGAFSFLISDKHFCVDSVKKIGYQLVDMDFCGKPRDYSATPMDVLMEIPGQSMEDYIEDFNRINSSQQALIGRLRSEVKQLKAQNKISEENYNRRLAEIAEMQSQSQKLVEDMANRYSKMDFDRVDEFYRQVGWLIINGELIKADSLLRTRGNITKQVEEQYQKGQAIHETETKLQQAKIVYSADKEELAQRCYGFHETFAAQHMNDSAAYYLELRASLDTMNVDWQNEVGSYVANYVADYKKALSYYQLALKHAIKQYGEQSEWAATIYGNMGWVYHRQDDYGNAMGQYKKALVIRKTILGENHPDVAEIYNSIGVVYEYQGFFQKALEQYKKALAIEIANFGENNSLVSALCNNIGAVYEGQGYYVSALSYYNMALAIDKAISGENHSNVATVYDNMGRVYSFMGDYDKALEFHNKALHIRKVLFGENHPDVAKCYHNIGVIYYEKSDFEKAFESIYKALGFYITNYGEKHFEVAKGYGAIGLVYAGEGDYDKALEFQIKGLSIKEAFLGENHPDVAISYLNIGTVYKNKNNYEKAMDYCDKALHIFLGFLGENHPKIAKSYSVIGSVYYDQNDYDKAFEYYNKALSIQKVFFGEIHPDIAVIYNCIGDLYCRQCEYDKALVYYDKALSIKKTIFGEECHEVAGEYNRIGFLYEERGDYDKALAYYKNALNIEIAIYGECHLIMEENYNIIGSKYFSFYGDYEKALEYYNKASYVQKSVFREEHPFLIKQQQMFTNTEYVQSIADHTLSLFCESHCFTITVDDGDPRLSNLGMSGEYVLLEYGDWNQDTPTSIYDKCNELRGRPLDILVIKDESVVQYHLENAIGAYIEVKYVGKEEKQRINKAYEEWKMQKRL